MASNKKEVRGSRYVDLDADEAGERLAALSVDEVRCTVTKECQGAYRPRRHGESYPSEPEQSFDVNLVAMKITCKGVATAAAKDDSIQEPRVQMVEEAKGSESNSVPFVPSVTTAPPGLRSAAREFVPGNMGVYPRMDAGISQGQRQHQYLQGFQQQYPWGGRRRGGDYDMQSQEEAGAMDRHAHTHYASYEYGPGMQPQHNGGAGRTRHPPPEEPGFNACELQELEAAMIEDELRAQGFSDEDIKNMEAMAAQEAWEQQQHAGRGRGRGRGRGVGRW